MKRAANSSPDSGSGSVPIFDSNSSSSECLEFYKSHQLLHYRTSKKQCHHPLDSLKSAWNYNKDKVVSQWGVENNGGVDDENLSAERILFGVDDGCNVFYLSCVLQDDDEILNTFLEGLVLFPPFVQTSVWRDFRHDDTIWIFLGKNLSNFDMQGRIEHTDLVDHNGAWHFQVSGKKIWRCRPVSDSTEWKGNVLSICTNSKKRNVVNDNLADIVHSDDSCKEEVERCESPKYLTVTCEAGDIFMINTRLWWHETYIPNTEDASEQYSMSYARDFYCPDACVAT